MKVLKVFLFGLYFISLPLVLKGKLETRGPSVTDICKQTLEKMESEAYLAKTAKDDPNPEIRQKALKRLKEINA